MATILDLLFAAALLIGGILGGFYSVRKRRRRGYVVPDVLDFAMGAVMGAMCGCLGFALLLIVIKGIGRLIGV